MKAPQKSLKNWTKQKWRTKSGKPSAKTGERYLPEAAIKSLSSAEYAATTKAKREGKAKGKQFVKQPKKIAQKTRKFRANEGGMAKKFPDLTGDGKITQADILKGRGVKGFKTGDKVKNTGGSEQLKRGRPKTTDVAGPKKFKNKQFKGSPIRDFMQGLEATKTVPRMGRVTRDPKTGKEMSTRQLTDTTVKRDFDKIVSEPKVTMDKSVAMKRARDADTSAKEDFKKGGKVKKAKKPRGCGMASKGVRNAKMITMKGS